MAQGHLLSPGDTHAVPLLSGTLCLAHQGPEAPQLPVALGQTPNQDKLHIRTNSSSCHRTGAALTWKILEKSLRLNT